jgi:hypothetical protein
MQEAGNRATLTLLEVCKVIIEEINLQYVDIKDPFLSVITYMRDIAKDAFRKDKSVNIKVLIMPFNDLKKLFKNEKIASHQDAKAILQSIDHVLEEFSMLESVMNTLPPMPKPQEGKTGKEGAEGIPPKGPSEKK